MNKVFLVFSVILFSCFLKSPTYAEKSREDKKTSTLFLPINHLGKRLITLVVYLPNNFKALGEFPSETMEFIPEGDDEQKYSRIVTVNVFSGLGMSASTFIDKMESGKKSAKPSFKLLKEDKKKKLIIPWHP